MWIIVQEPRSCLQTTNVTESPRAIVRRRPGAAKQASKAFDAFMAINLVERTGSDAVDKASLDSL